MRRCPVGPARKMDSQDPRLGNDEGPDAAAPLWVDADACPTVIKDILFRAAQRTGLPLTLVANQPLRTPPGKNIRADQLDCLLARR